MTFTYPGDEPQNVALFLRNRSGTHFDIHLICSKIGTFGVTRSAPTLTDCTCTPYPPYSTVSYTIDIKTFETSSHLQIVYIAQS